MQKLWAKAVASTVLVRTYSISKYYTTHFVTYLLYEIDVTIVWGNTLLCGVFVTMMKHDVRLFKKGSAVAGCSSQRLMVEYAHDEYCRMLRTGGVVTSIWL
jgi:hypothetical protein